MKKSLLLTALLPLSLPLNAALVDMWTFNDVGLGAVSDGATSVGVNGGIAVMRGAGVSSISTPGSRGIDLPGGGSATAGYIDLPNGLVSAGTEITMNTWVSINGIQGWSRIFDFGSTNTGSGTQGGELLGPGGGGEGMEYIMISAMNGTDQNTHRLEYRENQVTLNTTDGSSVYTLGSQHLWTFVWDDIGGGQATQAYYFDGNLVAQSTPFNASLTNLNDVNNWLGRSNWTGDANTDGTYDQFEIYNTAFTAGEVQSSFAAGPIPEPATPLILAGSLFGFLLRRRRA